uniref:Uncharacterized protein n=1 Tax=Glossina palpalis gambiensis TaxID=67801 RepID=A0A1B0C545_9MUSC
MKRYELLFGVIICLHLKIKSSAVLLDDQISSQALIQILENSWRTHLWRNRNGGACITNSRQDNLRDNSSSEPKTEIYTYAITTDYNRLLDDSFNNEISTINLESLVQ